MLTFALNMKRIIPFMLWVCAMHDTHAHSIMVPCTEGEPDTETVDTTGVQLDELSVVVPAIKETTPLHQRPASVAQVTSAQMQAQHITSLRQSTHLVPNLYIPDYGSRLTSAIYIRGIGSRINSPAVGLYVDNVPYIDKSAFDFNFYDIERIDVQRGPQGTLYGRNTMGGLVHVYTRNPFRYQGTDVRVGYATADNHRQASLTHYHRVSDTMAFSAGGYYEGGDGFFRNHLTGSRADAMQSGGGRVRGIWRPTQRLTFDASVGYDFSYEYAYPYVFTGALDAQGSLSWAGTAPGGINPLDSITANRQSRYHRSLLNGGLHTRYQGRGWQMNAVTGYQHLRDHMLMDQDFMWPDIYTLEQCQRIHTVSQEVTFRNTRPLSRWQWVSGAYLMYQNLHTQAPVIFHADGVQWLQNTTNTMMPPITQIPMLAGMGFTGMEVSYHGQQLPIHGFFDTPTLGAALFHQSSYRFTPRLTGTMGLRLDFEHLWMDYFSPTQVDYTFQMPNSRTPAMSVLLPDLSTYVSYQGSTHVNRLRLLPRLALQYELPSAGNIYVSAAMGQRSGGYNLQMFSDLLQGAIRVDMMQQIREGVGSYIESLSVRVPQMPTQIPDPENPGTMIPLADYVRRLMAQGMPQLQMPTTSQVVYRPEYSVNIEGGTHLRLLGDALGIDASVFYSRIYDQQIARFTPSGLGRMMVNAGRSHSYGFELSTHYTPIQALTLAANYGYTHATFLRYDDGQGHDYAHHHVPFVPTHTGSADAAYRFALPCGQHGGAFTPTALTVGSTLSGTGRVWWTEANIQHQPFYLLLGARVQLHAPRYTLTLWGRNLTNRRYHTFWFESAHRGFAQYGKPLQVGIDCALQF